MKKMLNRQIASGLKRVFAAVLALLIMASGNDYFTISAAASVPFTDKPDIRLTRMDMPAIEANKEFVVSLKLENLSPAFSVNRAKLTVNVPEGLTIMDSSNTYFVDGAGIPVRGSNTVDVRFKSSEKIMTENFQLSVSLEYNYWGREGLATGTENYTVFLPAKKTGAETQDGAPVLQVVRPKMDPVKAKGSYEFDLLIKNVNKKVVAKNIKVTMTAGNGFTVVGRASNRFIREIGYDEPYTLPIKIRANKTIEAESLDLTLNFSYSYDQAGSLVQGSDSERITIPAIPTDPTKESEEAGTLTPNIIVSSYSYGDKVEAGEKFDLNLTFKNTSKEKAVENIVLSLNTGEGISVSSSSNSFYFEKLPKNGELPLNVELKAWEEAKSAAAVLTINFSYEYRSGKSITKGTTSESISIPVIQPDRFELGKVENVEMMVGNEGYISIPYVNKGKATTSNISAKIEGEGFDSISKEIWVGNCNSGASGTIDVILTPNTPGEMIVKVLVEYEDPNSEKKTKEVELSYEVMEMYIEPPTDIGIEDIMPEENSNPKLKIILISGSLLLILIVLIVVVKKLKKRSNEKRMERLSHMYDWALSQGDEAKNRSDEEPNSGEK